MSENSERTRRPNGMTGHKFPGGKHGYRHEYRQEQVQKQQEARAQRSPGEQLRVLDDRLGVGIGASKERARLHALIEG